MSSGWAKQPSNEEEFESLLLNFKVLAKNL